MTASYKTDRHLCSWSELTPANNESANKEKSTRCSGAEQYLKPLLIQYALVAIKSRKEPYFVIKYQHLSKRRGKKEAIIAIARMMLTNIYHLLSDNEDFYPDDYEATVNLSPVPRLFWLHWKATSACHRHRLFLFLFRHSQALLIQGVYFFQIYLIFIINPF